MFFRQFTGANGYLCGFLLHQIQGSLHNQRSIRNMIQFQIEFNSFTF